MKRFFAAITAVLLLVGCAAQPTPPEKSNEQQLVVYATLFPQYDFAREIAGDRADVRLLLPAGVESHSFEPTPADIAGITKSDLLLYTGDLIEPWVKALVSGNLPESVQVVDLSVGIDLAAQEQGDDHDDHEHAFDPHIWTSPVHAMTMVEGIAAAFCAADPAGEAIYRANAAEYLNELRALDQTFLEIAAAANRPTLVFGGRFAFYHLAEQYGFVGISAYDSCSDETEPSAKAVAAVIDQVKRGSLSVVYYEELTEPKVAASIASETGAKLLLLHSCHNLSKDELAVGESYLSLMKKNAENIREGLIG